jgi:hypothetical protein
MLSYDLIIIGGGPAGIAAAVAAGRSGVKTLLIEKYGFCGGMATAARVNPFAGNCYINPHTGNAGDIMAGVFQEVLLRLKSKNAVQRYLFSNTTKNFYDAFEEEKLKIVYDEMLFSANVTTLYHTFLVSVSTSNNHIQSIKIVNKSGLQEIKAKYYIDSTGDADLAANSGVAFEVGRKEDGLCQPCTLMFRMGGIDKERLLADGLKNGRQIVSDRFEEARNSGRLDYPYKPWVQFYEYPRAGALHFNMTRIWKNSVLKSNELSQTEIDGRKQAEIFTNWVIAEVPEFKNAYLETMGVQVGVRESRRILGLYQMTQEDIIQGSHFKDGIARSGYFIDIHNPTGSVDQHMVKGDELKVKRDFIPKEFYEIPFRSLQQNKVDNLLVACRAISTTYEAHAATRVMATMHAVGEAAGIAIGICNKENSQPSAIDGVKVRNQITYMNQEITF